MHGGAPSHGWVGALARVLNVLYGVQGITPEGKGSSVAEHAASSAQGGSAATRREAVASGLLPIVRVADQPWRWTMAERQAHYGCPAVGVAAIKDGRIDWVDSFGVADRDDPRPVGPDTLYMVASCSKPVTAMIVLQQVERGHLDLDVDINTYLRRWQVPVNEFTAEHPVTLRRALSHTAGLNINGWGAIRQGDPVPTEFDLLEGRPPSHLPAVVVDKAYDGVDRYSGAGFLLSQMVLEDVLGRPFAELADEFVFTPLGMTRTTYAQPLPERYRTDVASGHGDDGAPMPGGWMIASEMAAGGLFSTPRDYATFLLAARSAYHGERGAILGHSLAREMMSREARGVFGLGFRVLGNGSTVRINHGGSSDGYQSETNLFLESGDGGVVLTNATSGLFLYREVHNALADVYGWPDFMPEPKHLHQMTREEMERLTGDFRILAGIELPRIKVWIEGDRLLSQVPGLRFGVQEVFCDVNGVLFNQTGPFETHVTYGPDGRASSLEVREGGVPMIRAEREG